MTTYKIGIGDMKLEFSAPCNETCNGCVGKTDFDCTKCASGYINQTG